MVSYCAGSDSVQVAVGSCSHSMRGPRWERTSIRDIQNHAARLENGCGGKPVRQRGFTLIEVMAAFAIFTVLFGITLQILSTSVSNTRRSVDFTQVALLARGHMDMVGIESLPEPGRYTGRYSDDYRWEMLIEPYLISDRPDVLYDELPVELYYVGLTVYWGEGRGERSAHFETLRSVDRFFAEREREGR